MCSDRKSASVEEYLRKLSGQEKEQLGITFDHNYVRPWYAHTDSQRTKPAKLLFMQAIQRPKSTYVYPDEEIDVVGASTSENPSQSLFDNPKTKVLSYEIERSLKCNPHIDADKTDLDNFPIEDCSFKKKEIYKEVMDLINDDIIAKMVFSGQQHEFIKRKITTEKCARKLRLVFANTYYDFELILWIHKLILDKGNLSSITSYLNILQVLSTKIPTIVDKILKLYSGSLGYEYLCQLLRKHWEPAPVLSQHKLRRLPGNPFLLMCCAGFNASKAMDKSHRFKFWMTHLNSLCKTAYIPADYTNKTTFEETLDYAMVTLSNKIIESKNHFPKRQVILAGWNIGALIACHVALDTAVDAIICFGFPLTGVNGSQGGLNDPLLECKVPILFIIGQNSNMCCSDDMEDFRSRLRVETGLVIVGGADDFLCVTPQKMLLEGITQEIVDRCILDEISEYLHATLVKMAPNQPALNVKKSIDDIEDISHIEQGRKRRRQQSTSEKSQKRMKTSNTKEASDTSKSVSSGSSKKPKQPAPKKMKDDSVKNEDKRLPIKPLRIKIPKPVVNYVNKKREATEKALLESKLAASKFMEDPAPKPAAKKLPFALNILPKKNEPVDVVKAFGNDCSFLPSYMNAELAGNDPIIDDDLLPPDDFLADIPLPIEDIEKLNEPVASSSIGTEQYESNLSNVISFAPEIIPAAVEPSVSSSSVTTPATSSLETNTVSVPVASSFLNFQSGSKAGMSLFATPSGFKSVMKEDKVLPSTSVGPIKKASSDVKSTSSVPSSSRKPIITVPSNAAALLLSGQTLKTPSGKFLQLVTKGPTLLKPGLAPQLVGSSRTNESVQMKSLSMLSSPSTVISPHSTSVPKKMETSSSATLVKLAATPVLQNFKQMSKFKASSSSSFPVKAETAAEMAEKQRAILELNKSLNSETATTSSRVNESSYTVFCTKPDGSIVARKVISRPPIHTTVRHSNSFL